MQRGGARDWWGFLGGAGVLFYKGIDDTVLVNELDTFYKGIDDIVLVDFDLQGD